MEGWRWIKVIHPDDVDGIVDKWSVSLATGEPFEAEARVRRADGQYRWFLHRKVPLRSAQGAILKWYGSSLVIETTRDFNGMSITAREVRRLDNGGKEMQVETTAQTPNGEQKRKTVYTKS